MRCPKCHFVSFDYLAHCKKCGTDLQAERERLNLLDFEPAFPSFFGVLDRTDLSAQMLAEPEMPPEAEAHPLELTLADLEGPDALAPEFVSRTIPEASREVPELAAEPLPELVLDDAEEAVPLEWPLDPAAEPVAPAGPVPTEAAVAEADGPIEFVLDDAELELELSPEEMERIILELDQAGPGQAAPAPKAPRRADEGENS